MQIHNEALPATRGDVPRTSNNAEGIVAVWAGRNPVEDIMRASASLPGKALPYMLSLKLKSQRFKGMT